MEDRFNEFQAKFSTVCFSVIVVIFGTLSGFSQADELKLFDVANGFNGSFKSGNQILKIDSWVDVDKSFETKITHSEGHVIAEVRYRNNLVTVTVDSVTIRFRKDDNTGGLGPVEGFSKSDQERLATYIKSNEASILRKMVSEIIKERRSDRSTSLKGVLIISLMLGEDGPGFPMSAAKVQKVEKNDNCRQPEANFVLASYSSPLPKIFFESARKGTNLECNETNCCGCCGAGCLGCTGCYTSACYLHDLCVDLYGHPACLGLLPNAIASILNECPVV
jgi:hypothetical protein